MSEHSTAESAVPTGRLVVQAVLRTDVGLVRAENQDFGTYTTPSEEREAHPGGRLLIVADGMGGHRGGATASRLAGEVVKSQYLGSDGDDVGVSLRDALARANARIHTEAAANPDLRGMGTTTSALVVRESNAWFAHVGDSRIYMVREGAIKQLTDDHSLVATMVREGLLTKSEAETHPRRNVLQRSMGVTEDVEIDIRGPFPVQPDDIFILCSDGLHGVVKEDEMNEVVTGRAIREAADEFIRLAIERGAPDNVTVIVARVIRAEDAGDETMLDVETRRDTAKISAYVDTIADEPQPAAAVAPIVSEAPAEPAAAVEEAVEPPPPVSAAEAQEEMPIEDPATADTLEVPTPDEPQSSGGGSMVKWMLLVVLALGAAGVWLLWNHQQGIAATTTSTPSSR